MAKKEFIKKYNGISHSVIPWINIVELFDLIWGKEFHSLPKFPQIIGGVFVKWQDKDENHFTPETLEEVQTYYENGELNIFTVTSIGQELNATLLFDKNKNSLYLSISSENEDRVRSSMEKATSMFPIQISTSVSTSKPKECYVDPRTINSLSEIKSPNFDLKKLIQLCKELNEAFISDSYYSVGILVRAIIDHIPPIFNFPNFEQVANNYGSQSFKASMKHLSKASKPIADGYLHDHIKKKIILPTKTQVDFRASLDQLLSEIITKLT